MLRQLYPVKLLHRSERLLFREIVDGDGVDVELQFPLQQPLYFVGVAVLAACRQ